MKESEFQISIDFDISYDSNNREYIYYNDELTVFVKCLKKQSEYAAKKVKRILQWYCVNQERVETETAKAMLETANAGRPDSPLTAEELKDIMVLTDISVNTEKKIKLYYSAIDIFDCHSVVAEYSSDDGFLPESESYRMKKVYI